MTKPFDEEDLELDDAELCEKYGGYWGVHPHFGLEDWRYEVENNYTRCGYWDWVYNRIENSGDQQ